MKRTVAYRFQGPTLSNVKKEKFTLVAETALHLFLPKQEFHVVIDEIDIIQAKMLETAELGEHRHDLGDPLVLHVSGSPSSEDADDRDFVKMAHLADVRNKMCQGGKIAHCIQFQLLDELWL